MLYKLTCSRPQHHYCLMYKIIGADQKEYGPVSTEQLRQWVGEGRVNAQTRARAEGESEWKPLSSFPEFADVLRTTSAATPSLPPGGAGGAPPETVLARDYNLDIGYCISRSWELLKQNFWPVVGISLLIMVISGVINQVLGLASGPVFRGIFLNHRITPGGMSIIFGTSLLGSPIYTLLMGGLFKYYLKLIRAEGATIADAFSGFGPQAGQLILLGLVNGFLTTLAYLLCVLPGIYVSISWIFALPLVVDRNIHFWDAMELSRKVVSKHWFIVFAFLLVVGLLAVCGAIACCVGIFVTIPLASVAIMYAYEDIFGQKAA
jgi:hypothetical protein